ncbi:MAG: phytanoyl-CoA dioxygenase family protein [Planctomycetota bacterium]|jgi:hypothetical protein|nr:phytanoyl-CoA dioxygenase family protein [Planctomycetota bacterium]MDP7252613.1 phytanoyl-CoA dioxygenase family protein [Planctomycetota bacterium]
MTEEEKYLFDVHGYLLIEGALSPAEVEAANAAIDHHPHKIQIRPNDLARMSRTLSGKTGRGDLGGMLTWEKPYCDPFREMIVHPGYSPHLEYLLGPGFRLEGLGLITMDEGAEGFWFHEGGEPLDRSRSYLYRNGRMYCGMTNVAVQLSDVNPGDGGFACVPGSHKANYPCPDEMRLYHIHQDRFVQIPAKAGDALLFVECLMHGTLPWAAKHQRRSLIIRYNSGVTASGVMGTWTPPAFYDELTNAQKAVISMPQYRYEDKGSALYKKQEKDESEE